MTSRTKLWALSAGALALSLALAGCGGGGSGGSPAATNTGDSGAPPLAAPAPMEVSLANVTTDGDGYMAPAATGDTPLEIEAGMSATSGSVTFECAAGEDCTVMVADDGTVTSTGGMVTAMNSTAYAAVLAIEAARVAALGKETALRNKVAALQPLAGADDAAGSALMMAKKYAVMFGTLASDGDSLVAKNNAQKVLDARTDLMAAIAAAKMAKEEATTAKDGLDAGQTDLIGTLEEAIRLADEAIMEAQALLDAEATETGSLASYVRMVTGADEDNLKSAEDRGMEVAEAVAMALAPSVVQVDPDTAVNGAGLRAPHEASVTTAPTGLTAAVAKANRYQATSHDPNSMTWAMLVGEANVEMKPLGTITSGTFAPGNAELPAASIADMVLISTQAATDPGVTESDGQNYGVSYKGIPGTAICLGTDCKVEAVANVGTTGQDGFVDNSGNRKFAGSWYFTPTNAMAIYMKDKDDDTTVGVDESERYVQDNDIVRYGHWLVVDDGSTTPANEGQVTVNTYAYGPAIANTAGWGEKVAGTPSSEQAIYTGMAAGRSVHKVSNEDVAILETHSGRFTANVVLTAKFGATPMLGGTVSGFTSDNPDAVDPDWMVTLKETAVTNGAVAASTDGTTGGITMATGQNGVWSAASYGGADDNTGTVDVNETKRPAGIFGGFNAHFTDGHVAGAYATRND